MLVSPALRDLDTNKDTNNSAEYQQIAANDCDGVTATRASTGGTF